MINRFLILFLVACGNVDHPEGFEEREAPPKYVSLVAAELGLEVEDFKNVNFVVGHTEFCEGLPACAYPHNQHVFIEWGLEDNCYLVVHELLHVGLWIQTNHTYDGHDHKHPVFERENIICE